MSSSRAFVQKNRKVTASLTRIGLLTLVLTALVVGFVTPLAAVAPAQADSPDGSIVQGTVPVPDGEEAGTVSDDESQPDSLQFSARAEELTLNRTQFIAAAAGDYVVLEVITNLSWTLAAPSWTAPWMVSGAGSAAVLINIDANQTGLSRLGSVVVTASSGTTRTMTISQASLECGQNLSTVCVWNDLTKPITGVIDPGGDVDWYRFTVPSSGPWVFTSTGGGLANPVGTVYQGAGTVVATNSGGAGNGQFRIVAPLIEKTVYFLEVKGSNSTQTGGFTVTAAQTSTSLSLSPASVVAPARGMSPLVNVSSNTTWSISIPSDVSGWVGTAVSSGAGDRSSIPFNIQANTTGMPRSASVTFATTSGSPALSRAFTVTQESLECGTTISSYCTWGNLTKSMSGVIDTAGDRDWYRFLAPTSGPWTFTSSRPATNALADPYGTLYSDIGTPIVSDDNSGGNNQFQITASLTAGQAYYLEIRAANNTATGGYTVTASNDVPSLAVSSTAWTAPADGGSQTVTVTSNTAWSVSVPNWMSATPAAGSGNGSVTLQAQLNSTGASRTDVVTFTTTGASSVAMRLVSVTQGYQDCGASTVSNCPWPDLSQPVSGLVEPFGDKDWYRFVAPSTGLWTFRSAQDTSRGLTIPYGTLYAADGTTMIASNYNGAPDSQFLITASLTSGQVYYLEVRSYYPLYWGWFTVSASVEALSLTVAPDSFAVPTGGGSQVVSLTSTAAWTSSGPSWVSVSPASGSGQASVMVQAQANTTGAPRTGVVTFTAARGSLQVSRTVTVTQDVQSCGQAASSACSWSGVSQPASGMIANVGAQYWFKFVAPSTGPWTFTSSTSAVNGLASPYGTMYSANGMTLVAYDYGGAGNGQFKISVVLTAGQTYYLMVRDNLNMYTGGFTVTAAQQAVSFTVSSGSWTSPAGGDVLQETLTTNTNWSVSKPTNVSWLTLNVTSGSGNGYVRLKTQANTTGAARSCVVTFTTTSGSPQVTRSVTVTQPPQNVVQVSSAMWIALTQGGTQTFAVSSDEPWTVAYAPAWVDVTEAGSDDVTLTMQPNTTGKSRVGVVMITDGSDDPEGMGVIQVSQPG